MFALANPGKFLRLANLLEPWLKVATPLAFALGLYLALFASPPDYQQGDTVRIMYVHVPSAWLAMSLYFAIGLASATGLIWRHRLAFFAAQALSPLGAGLTVLALISGALWGRPMWGAYWVWDARLTSFLLLLFLYIGHIVLTHAFDQRERGEQAAAIIAIVGMINLPIIKFSVEWWNTLHQGASLLRLGGPTIDGAFLWPLGVMALAFHLYVALLFLWRMRILILEARG
ncbi:MAG TPA: heme ABC transporter permease CcmC [Dongiaceae bacterium]|nr:heme ABC transporter permease CcmC [Dongiaceae bacterium]